MNKITTEIRIYKNKTRQGTYLTFKTKGKPTRSYKVTPGIPEYILKQYYIDRYIKQKPQGTLQQYKTSFKQKYLKEQPKRAKKQAKQVRFYIKNIKRRLPEIIKSLKTGTSEFKIKNVKLANTRTYQKARLELLKNHVLDDQILKMMTQPHNFTKIQNRIDYRLEIYNKNKEKLITAEKLEGTMEQAVKDIRESVKIGIYTKGKIIGEGDGSPEWENPITNNLKSKNWRNISIHKDGTVKTADLIMTFRKG